MPDPTPKPAADTPGTATGRRIAGNFGLLTVCKVLSDVFTFGLFVVLAQVFGRQGIGEYSLSVGIASGFAVFADFGLYRLSIKDLARRDGDFAAELAALFGLRLILTTLVLIAMAGSSLVMPIDQTTRQVLLIVGLHLVGYTIANGLNAVFIARQHMFLAAGLDAGGKALAAAVGIALALLDFDMVIVLWALPGATLGQIVVSAALVQARYGLIHVTSIRRIALLLRDARAYVVSTAVRYVAIRSDVVLLGFLRGETFAGLYNVAYRVVFLLMYIPIYAALAVFPVLSRQFHSDTDDPDELIQSSLGWMILVGVPVSTGVWLIADPLLHLVFGETFADSIIVLRMLAWVFVLACLRNMLSTILTAGDRQALRSRLEAAGAVLAVTGNAVLISLYGVVGAAAAVLAAESALVVMLIAATWSLLDPARLAARLIIAIAASAAFVIPARLMPGLSMFIIVPAGCIIYTAVVLMFSTIRQHEWRLLKSLRQSGGEAQPITDNGL